MSTDIVEIKLTPTHPAPLGRASIWAARSLRVGARVAALAVLVAIWWAIAALRVWPPIFVPPPDAVWDQFIRTSTVHHGVRGYSGHLLYELVWASMRRILIGAGAAIALGVPLGLLIGSLRPARTVVEPGLTFVRSLPPLAYYSLLVIWFGIDETPKEILLFLAALPPVVIATSEGVRNVPRDRVLAVQTLGAGRLQSIRHVVLPSVLPEVMSGVRVAVGFAFTTVVAAETINGMPGIGAMVLEAERFNQTDVVVLGIIVIGACGIALDGCVRIADHLLVPWRGHR
jgi:taurine transport system permease protein